MRSNLAREAVVTRIDSKRERRKAWTRGELLLAGRKLFSEKGLYESRIEDLTKHAGIAKGTLYQYFRNKDELIQEVVAMGFAELAKRVDSDARGARSFADQAERIALAHYEFFVENPDLMRVFHQVRGLLKFDQRRWQMLRTILLRHLQMIADLLAVTPEAAQLSRARRWELATMMFGAVSGIASVQASVRAESRGHLRLEDLSAGIAAMAMAGTTRFESRARRASPARRTPSRRPAVLGGRAAGTPRARRP